MKNQDGKIPCSYRKGNLAILNLSGGERMPEQIKINEMDIICPGKVRKLKLLNEYFCGVELTEHEKQSLAWLAEWEESTVVNIISAFHKVCVGV